MIFARRFARPARRLSGLVAALSLAACAPTAPPTTAAHWSKEVYRSGGAASSAQNSPGSSTAGMDRLQPHAGQQENRRVDMVAAPPARALLSMDRIEPPEPFNTPRVSGKKCLRELRRSGARFRELEGLKGVSTPVQIEGPLGGVEYWANDGRALQMDCRLALALQSLSDVMREHGVKRIRYSGAYSYRTTRSGRLSHHAHGLAIDLHDFEIGAQTVSIERDFATHVGCQEGISHLNALTCSLRERALFEEFLTPDYNVDHRDHLHIAVPRRVE